MNQLTFDLAQGRSLRDEGLALVEYANKEFVALMRSYAVSVAKRKGHAHIDDVREYAIAEGMKPKSSNAWGAVFRGKGWVKTGYRASKLVSNRGHVSPIWAWVGE